MNTNIEKKLRRTEIITGINLAVFILLATCDFLHNKNFSMLDTYICALPFAVSLAVSVMFIIGRFRRPPARYIMGALFAVSVISLIWQIFSDKSLVPFLREFGRFPLNVINQAFLAAASFMCALICFGVIRFRSKASLMVILYILIALSAYVTFVLIESDEFIAPELVLIAALCFLPENKTDKEKPDGFGILGFNLIAVAEAAFALFILAIAPLIKHDKVSDTATLLIIIPLVLIIVLGGGTGVCIAPLLLNNKQFENDQI